MEKKIYGIQSFNICLVGISMYYVYIYMNMYTITEKVYFFIQAEKNIQIL